LERVLPAFPPLEGFREKVIECPTVDMLVKRPACRDVTNHKHTLLIPLGRQFVEKQGYSLDRFSPTLASREWGVEATTPFGI